MKSRRRSPGSTGSIRRVPLTVLIVDDHATFRRFARRVLEADGLEVVGEASDAASALAAVRALRPGLVLLDVMLPDGDGCEVAGRLLEAAEATRVVLTSSHDALELEPRIARSRAHGFVHKDELSGPA